ncbi:hypothetical protein [Prevotella nigrescens]|uniref:hypothetical protein n=1 Tax=Prevotella nigrescens TaxID=28133 RepID=UPI0028807CBF|nr:hypothetical protein [Prevotella nigrescens]
MIMIKLDPKQEIDVEAIYSHLLKKKNIPTRFRLPYTAKQVYAMLYAACKAEVAARMRQFTDTAEYKTHIWDIAKWLTSDEHTFGLFICGNKGNGKTTLVQALQSLYFYLHSGECGENREPPYSGFRIVTAKELVQLAKADNNPTRENSKATTEFRLLKNIEILCIDDLGTEPCESLNYGDTVTAVTDIIHYRYQKQFCTITTSNLTTYDIASYYDERLHDRFKEMMCVVNFGKEPSFR